MPARLNRRHQDMVRQKIQATQLINGLQKHIDGDREMSATQIQASKILLDKALSNAPTVVAGMGDEGEHKFDVRVTFAD
jgi:hypothetical protein